MARAPLPCAETVGADNFFLFFSFFLLFLQLSRRAVARWIVERNVLIVVWFLDGLDVAAVERGTS